MQVYAHRLSCSDDVVEWVKGTLLTDYARRMPAALFEAFVGRYRNALRAQLGDPRPYLYPFKRTLFWATR